MIVQLLDPRHMQLMGQRLAQRHGSERWVRQPGELVVFGIQLLEQRAAEQGLTGAHFAGHLDEALAFGQSHAQQVQARLVRRQANHEAGIRRQCEWLFLQAEECFVHTDAYLTCRNESALRRSSSSQT